MGSQGRRAGGFSLVELLAVITIIVLLVSLLVPTLGKGRELARKAVCTVNFRNTGMAFLAFAANREGRFPNKASAGRLPGVHEAVEDNGYTSNSGPWFPVWQNIINREYFKGNSPLYYPTPSDRWKDEPTCGPLIRFWTFWDTDNPPYYKPAYLKTRYMACPNYRPWGTPPGYSNDWCRPWIANTTVVGGWDGVRNGFPTPDTFAGTLGKREPYPQAISQYYTDYALGTRMMAFGEPASTFMIWEAEAAYDVHWLEIDAPNGGRLIVNDSPASPPWSAGASPGIGIPGYFAFRHVLPPDKSSYQTQAQANILYVDGHVGTLRPSDPIALTKHFRTGP